MNATRIEPSFERYFGNSQNEEIFVFVILIVVALGIRLAGLETVERRAAIHEIRHGFIQCVIGPNRIGVGCWAYTDGGLVSAMHISDRQWRT